MSQLSGPVIVYGVAVRDSVGTEIIDSWWTTLAEAQTQAATFDAAVVVTADGVQSAP